MPCPLCEEPGPAPLWRDAACRVVLPADAEAPGTCRVILGRHAAEMTDLAPAEQQAVLRAVLAVERALRELLRPDKVNLASLGNVTPHVHWHVIPRWADDPWFPRSIWGAPLRAGVVRPVPAGFARALEQSLGATLGAPSPR